MIITFCHMVFQCQTHLVITVAMLINHVFFHVCFSTKAWHRIGRPQTWSWNIYICVGTSLIWWLVGEHTLPHGFSMPATSSNYCGNAHQPCVFFHVCFSIKACHGFGRPQTWALNKYICVGTSLTGWLDHKHTLQIGLSVPDTSSKQYHHAQQPCVFFHVGFSTMACHWFRRPQTWALNIYICVGTSLIGWLDGQHTLPHGFSVPATSSNYCGHAHQPCVFFHVGFSTKACHGFARPQTRARKIYICVGTSLIG